jgi:protein-disulfide isomerase
VINPQVKLRVPVSERDHRVGSDEAVLQMVEYGDYECPHCRDVYPVVTRLCQTLNDELQVVFRQFPLAQIHPDAMNAARTAEAAGRQGKFWPMHEMLFENRGELDPESLLRYAAALRLDINRFSLDFMSTEVEDRILEDQENGIRSGVNGTPTFFVNGFRWEGALSYDAFLYTLRSVRTALTR